MSNNATVIYKRKRSSRAANLYRVGTWKVAYADFITAMMAFFLMLWLLSVTPKSTLQGVAQYFAVMQNAREQNTDDKTDQNATQDVGATNSAASSLVYGSSSRGRRINQADNTGMMADVEKQHFLDIMSTIQRNVEIKDYMDNISIDVTEDGLRIQIMDSDNRPVFRPNSDVLQPYMYKVLTVIGKMIKGQPNYLAISGHTASIRTIVAKSVAKTDRSSPSVSSNVVEDIDYWSLSARRANEIRKFLTKDLIKDEQVARIVGKADREPFNPKDPFNVQNIRVSVTLLNSSSISRYQQSAPIKQTTHEKATKIVK